MWILPCGEIKLAIDGNNLDGQVRYPAWCRDQRCVRNYPNPRLGSDDADIARASQLQHAVEDMDRHVHFSHPTFVHTSAQPVADHLFPPPDRRLDLGAPAVAGRFCQAMRPFSAMHWR
jgi:hypothetical protein